MTNVEFNEGVETYTSHRIFGEEIVPGMVKWLASNGVAKDKRQAEIVLVGTIVVCITISVFFCIRRSRVPTMSVRPL